jgi:hypothetical protein
MRAVARLKWDDQYKPEGWDYELYKKYNNGRPDVVFMAYDGESRGYNKGEGEYVSNYDDGKAAQVRFLSKQNKQGKQKESAMKKASKETDSNKESGYSKELDAQIELVVKDLMKNFGWSKEEARKAVSEA